MGETPDEIRDEIEGTRARMSETVSAIGYKADVKNRTKEAIVDKKDSLIDKGRGAVERVAGAMPDVGEMASKAGEAGSSAVSTAGDAVPSREQVKHAASVAQSNPLGLMLGSVAVGFVVGLALPSTRLEDEKIGEIADDLKQQAKEVGQEAARHGREIAQETVQSATAKAQEAGREHGTELAETVQERAQEVGSTSSDDR
jgi:Protein of unknown function (DUF3618)